MSGNAVLRVQEHFEKCKYRLEIQAMDKIKNFHFQVPSFDLSLEKFKLLPHGAKPSEVLFVVQC